MRLNIVPFSKVIQGDIIYTYDILDNPYSFVVSRIENKTEGNSENWGKVFYDKSGNFITEKAIAKIGGIFGKTEERKGFVIRIGGEINE